MEIKYLRELELRTLTDNLNGVIKESETLFLKSRMQKQVMNNQKWVGDFSSISLPGEQV